MGSTDLFSSSYGPGVVGTFMALIVLLGFGGLYMMVGDNYLKGGPPIEAVIAENANDISHLKKSISARTASLAEHDVMKKAGFELQRLEVTTGELEKRVAHLQSEVATNQAEIDQVNSAFEDYKARYRESARLSMIDRVFDELRGSDGTVYKNVKVTSIDPVRLNFKHDNGIGKVSLSDLPADIKDFLQFSEVEATDHAGSEQMADAALGDAVKIAQQEDKVIRLENDVREQRNELEKARSSLDRARRAIPVHERSIRQKRMEIASERQKSGVSRVPQMKEELSQMESALRKVQRAIPDLTRTISELTDKVSETEKNIVEARSKLARLHAGEKE
ncbi:chromosome segregation ATPase [Haloferula luteola]|uniref:Chromosome segregation ATPase n=1 Tax=Haloferula luteola TaxID=595692 RepID=A0A840VDY9_9BACT|nr:hypothetical protein [Haloferula luteola]MBB5352848.1 chromosome segregation ATPase [Haloferula luteola]